MKQRIKWVFIGLLIVLGTYSAIDKVWGDEGDVDVMSTVCGDMNGDGRVSTMDAILTLSHIAGLEGDLSTQQVVAADTSRDGELGIDDVMRILMHQVQIRPLDGCGKVISEQELRDLLLDTNFALSQAAVTSPDRDDLALLADANAWLTNGILDPKFVTTRNGENGLPPMKLKDATIIDQRHMRSMGDEDCMWEFFFIFPHRGLGWIILLDWQVLEDEDWDNWRIFLDRQNGGFWQEFLHYQVVEPIENTTFWQIINVFAN